MNYSDYTAREFLNDEYFQNWVLQPDAESNLFWENWLAQHPHQQAEADKARQLLRSLLLKPSRLPEDRVARIWDHLQEHIEKARPLELKPAAAVKRPYRLWYQMAAVFLGLLAAGMVLWNIRQAAPPTVVVTTGFGQTRQVVLPDHSIAVLNGNSALEYPAQWQEGSARQVQLRGEAYFAVTHTRSHQPFRVQLSQAVQVQVLGTRFVVTSRPRKTQVVLQEGKVRVDISQQAMLGLASRRLAHTVMQPGQLVEVRQKAGSLDKRRAAHPETYLAFLQSRIVFKDTPLAEVARVLEDTYGYKVSFSDPSLARKRFTGSGQPQRVDMLLTAIEKSFQLEIIRRGKNLVIKPR
jgi:transmembrane sensor